MRNTVSERSQRDRGAAAVEFAFILPILLLILGGIVDFGRAMYTQSILTNAAREGARVAVIGEPTANVVLRAKAAVPTGMRDDVNIPPPSQACPGAEDHVTVTAEVDFDWIIVGPMMNFFGASGFSPQLSSSATMRCGG